MKRWQSILLQIGFAVGAALIPTIKSPTVQTALGAAAAAAVAATASKTSASNPDGTPAALPYQPEKE